MEIYETLYLMTTENTLFLNIHKIIHMLGHKANLKNFEKAEIIQGIISFDHNAIKLKSILKKKTENLNMFGN